MAANLHQRFCKYYIQTCSTTTFRKSVHLSCHQGPIQPELETGGGLSDVDTILIMLYLVPRPALLCSGHNIIYYL